MCVLMQNNITNVNSHVSMYDVIMFYLRWRIHVWRHHNSMRYITWHIHTSRHNNSIHLFTGYEDNSKFIVPRDTNYFPTRSESFSLWRMYYLFLNSFFIASDYLIGIFKPFLAPEMAEYSS
jgi:hypothetical protein